MAATQTDLRALFADLEISADTEPMPEPVRSRESLPNPFAEPLRASVEHGTSYSIYVPQDAVQRSVFLINAAARKENLGVRVVVNIQRDDKGRPVKGTDGKAQVLPETRGPNKGKVLVRFQGNAQRKQTKPRAYVIVKNPADPNGKALKETATGNIVATGTHDEMRAELKARKTQTPATA